MKPRRLHSATILSMLTMSVGSVIGAGWYSRPARLWVHPPLELARLARGPLWAAMSNSKKLSLTYPS